MKPIIIIVIAVICSVVAVFSVLIALDLYNAYLFEQAMIQESNKRVQVQQSQDALRLQSNEITKKVAQEFLEKCKQDNIGDIRKMVGCDTVYENFLRDYIKP